MAQIEKNGEQVYICDYKLRNHRSCGQIAIPVENLENRSYCPKHIFRLFMSDNDTLIIRHFEHRLYGEFIREGSHQIVLVPK